MQEDPMQQPTSGIDGPHQECMINLRWLEHAQVNYEGLQIHLCYASGAERTLDFASEAELNRYLDQLQRELGLPG